MNENRTLPGFCRHFGDLGWQIWTCRGMMKVQNNLYYFADIFRLLDTAIVDAVMQVATHNSNLIQNLLFTLTYTLLVLKFE